MLMEKSKVLTQEEFNEYIRKLNPKEDCQFMIRIGIALCNQNDFRCPYKSREAYTIRTGPRRECKREQILRYKKILGARNP